MIIASIAGTLGREAELKQTSAGPICSFSIATNGYDKGEKTTTWIRCAIFGKRGERLVNMLMKGSKVTVFGELKQSLYEGKIQNDIRVDNIELQGGGQRNESGGGHAPAPVAPVDSFGATPDDSDFPFVSIERSLTRV